MLISVPAASGNSGDIILFFLTPRGSSLFPCVHGAEVQLYR